MKSRILFLIVIIAILVIFSEAVLAQGCSQCRLGPASNLDAGGNVARGINSGILYLMLIPYLLFMGIMGYFFKNDIIQKWQLFKNLLSKKQLHP